MKVKTIKLNAKGRFVEKLENSIEEYYKQAISENIKRGLARKKELGNQFKK